MSNKIERNPKIYLNKVHLNGFKSIEDLSINFQKGLNVLIGKNGAGKTNFMEFITRLLKLRSDVFYNYAKIEFVSYDDHFFEFELQRTSQNLDLDEDDLDKKIGLHEKVSIDGQTTFDSLKKDNNLIFKNKKIAYRNKMSLRNFFSRLGYPAIYPLYLKYSLPDVFDLNCLSFPGTLKIDLEKSFTTWQLAPTLDSIEVLFNHIEAIFDDDLKRIKNINKSSFYKLLKIDSEIKDNLKRFSNIEDIKFNDNLIVYNDDKSITVENIKIDFKVNGNWIPWSQLSDGTQRLFYIISEITVSNGLILIEEPELGIHPHQFNLLMDFLKEQSEIKQLIISTHSPKALDHLSPDELSSILITSYSRNDGTKIRHLTTKEVSKAKKYMKEVGFFSDYWMLSDLE